MNHNHITHQQCFDSFNALSFGLKYIIKRMAAAELVLQGYDEVGSSDVNCSIFDMWKSCAGDWNKVVSSYLDLQQDQHDW